MHIEKWDLYDPYMVQLYLTVYFFLHRDKELLIYYILRLSLELKCFQSTPQWVTVNRDHVSFIFFLKKKIVNNLFDLSNIILTYYSIIKMVNS